MKKLTLCTLFVVCCLWFSSTSYATEAIKAPANTTISPLYTANAESSLKKLSLPGGNVGNIAGDVFANIVNDMEVKNSTAATTTTTEENTETDTTKDTSMFPLLPEITDKVKDMVDDVLNPDAYLPNATDDTSQTSVFTPSGTTSLETIFSVVQVPLQTFQSEIKVLSNVLIAIFALLIAIAFIVNCVKLAGTATEHPMIRRQVFINLGLNLGCEALLGATALITRVIILLALGA